MLGLTLAVVLQASVISADPDVYNYQEARAIASKEGTPIVVLVGATWCPACVQMKTSVMPSLKKQGKLNNVLYVELDIDKEKKLGHQMLEGTRIPQLVMYYHEGDVWKNQRLIGGQSTTSVERFIQNGIELSQTPTKNRTVSLGKTTVVKTEPENK